MAHLSVIALSINGGLKTLGSYAGLAAVVALALLALLFFAQARELKRLREWIEQEAQRPRAQAPARVGVPAPAPRPAPAPAAPLAAPLATGAASTPATPLVATTVEGVRRVPLPSTGAVAAGGTVVLPGGATPNAPDATTVNEPAEGDGAPPPASALQAPRLVAERARGQEPGSAHEVGEGLVIGRAKGVSIRLSDPLVSGRHARIAPDGEGVALEDLGSTNGTFLNGAQLSAPAILSNGDRIRLGESEFVYEVVPASPPDPPETPVAAGVPPAPTDAEGIPAPEPTGGEAGPELEPSDSAGVVPTDDGDEARDSSAAVPLLAAPIPERTLEFEDPDAGAGGSAMPPLPPAPRAAGTGAVRLPPAAISRMPRGGLTAEDQADEAPRRARRVRGWDPQLPGVGSTGRRLALAGIAAAIAAIAVVVVLLASGGGTKGTSSSSTAATSSAAPARSSITVAVLNGTTTTGLAGRLSKKLVGEGFAKGVVADASSQTAATTSVGYTNGNKVAADEVARALRLSATSVVPVTSANDATASAAGGRPQVVVTIGVQHPQ